MCAASLMEIVPIINPALPIILYFAAIKNNLIMNHDKEELKQTELKWIEEIRAGNRDSFKKLFENYYHKLCWFVNRYVQSAEIADDIVKELFTELWQRKEKIIIQSSFNAYLYAAARNRAINYLKSKRAKEQKLIIHAVEYDELLLIRSKLKDPSEQLEQKELTETIHEAVDSLPGRTKLVFTLHRDDGLSYAEIALVLEISVKTVENQMARAFRILRNKLSYLFPLFLIISSTSVKSVI
jgi:RNA polymerase sigma-70 factor, ECF subfamily